MENSSEIIGSSKLTSIQRFTGWVAIIGSAMAWLTIFANIMAMGMDSGAMRNPSVALSLSPISLIWFQVAQITDIFGYYLPFLVIGGYVWKTMRTEGGAIVDIAILFLTIFVAFGVAGAVIQFATIVPLSIVHRGVGALTKSTSESIWLAIVFATEGGLWMIEGPLFGFWAIVNGKLFHAHGWGYGRILIVSGCLFMGWFITELFGMSTIYENMKAGAVILLAFWMALFGINILRRPAKEG